MNIQNNKNFPPEQNILYYQTFSEVFFYSVLVYLTIYSVFVYSINLGFSEFSNGLRILIDILLLIILFPFLYGTISPYQKIEFTKSALLMSFLHKSMFLLTAPFLISSILIVENFKRVNSFFSIIFLTFIYDFFWVMILVLIWAILTELIWDFITDLLNIQTAKRRREANLKANEQFGVNKILIRFILSSEQIKAGIESSATNRWELIAVEIPLLIGILSIVFYNYFYLNLLRLNLLFAYILLTFLYLLPGYRPIFIHNNISLNLLIRVNQKLFGLLDISHSARNDSIVLSISLASLMALALVFIKSKIVIFVISFFLYVLMIAVFLVSIWSNKIFTSKVPLLDWKTKAIHDQLQMLIRNAIKEDSLFPLNETNFYFRDFKLIQKILPYPFDSYNWIIFNFRNPLFNPFVIKELASIVEMDIDLTEFFSEELLKVFIDLDLKPWERYTPEVDIYNKIIQLYNFKVSDFQEKTQNRIFFFNFRNTFLLCDHSINPLIAEKFMYYYDNFLKKIVFSSKIVDSISMDSKSNSEKEIPSELIYWNVNDQFLNEAMIKNSNFLIDQRHLREKNSNKRIKE